MRTRLNALLRVLAAAAFAAMLSGSMNAAEPPEDKPNILFIMVDDLGPQWISCYGGEEVETPNVDALSAGGMKFINAYSMPQCTPTRATLLTGQYPWRHGWINHWDVPRWGVGQFDAKHNASFARVMQSAGYVTAAAGKWQINDFRREPEAMKEHGFDEYCLWTGFEADNPPSAERYWDAYIRTDKEESRTYEGQFGPDVYNDFLIDFMRRHKDEPMMLYYPMALTHGPTTSTPHKPDITDNKEKFRAMVEYTDYLTGRLIEALDELGIRERTIVIWTTDNGGGYTTTVNGREIKGGKGTTNENGAREPFIVNCPGRVPAGVVTDALTDFTDMLPTFAELGGAKLAEDMVLDGHSIAPLILGQAEDSPREWIMAMGGGAGTVGEDGRVKSVHEYRDRVIRDKQYKLWIDTNRQSVRLHDLLADPFEENNLIGSTEPDVVAARKKLETVAKAFPDVDPSPRYDPLPPRPWDKKPGKSKGEK